MTLSVLQSNVATAAAAALLLPLLAFTVSAATAAGETATLRPTEGAPGTPVKAFGSGWVDCGSNGSMTIRGWGQELGAAKIIPQGKLAGEFAIGFKVPDNAAPGEEMVRFEPGCQHSTWMPFVKFTVTPAQGGKGSGGGSGGGGNQGRAPTITRTETSTDGVMVWARVYYNDVDGDAGGFGFRGAKGSRWAEESHPFNSPSYGRVIPGGIEYPFNHGCGGANQYESDIEFWIYDKAGNRSAAETTHLACSTHGGGSKVTSLLVTKGITKNPVTQGETYFSRTIGITAGSRLALSKSADGKADVELDDVVRVEVAHRDGTRSVFTHDFTVGQCARLAPAGPFDLQRYLKPGYNQLKVVLSDKCGVSAGTPALYLVGDFREAGTAR